jgi:hypothetical protein
MNLARFPLVLVAFSFLTACGSTVDKPADIASACASFVASRHAYEAACPVPGASTAADESTIASCIGLATAPGARISPADIEACSAELSSLACAENGSYPSCAGHGQNMLFPSHDKKGTLAAGEACVAHMQCASGYCGAFWGECGACVIPRALGEACDGEFDSCTEGNCISGKCALPGVTEGEKCINYGGGDCQSTLFCEVAMGAFEGVCVKRGETGAACAESPQCVDGLYCAGGACAAKLPDGASCGAGDECVSICIDGVCRAPKMGLGPGADCQFDSCAPDLSCSADLVCVERTYLDEGAPCTNWNTAGAPCAPGLYCDLPCTGGDCSGDGVCAKLPGPGEACTYAVQCAEGSLCMDFMPGQGNSGVCTKLGELGEACPCADDLACVADTCVAFGEAMCSG